jgi:hypothetical protein
MEAANRLETVGSAHEAGLPEIREWLVHASQASHPRSSIGIEPDLTLIVAPASPFQ